MVWKCPPGFCDSGLYRGTKKYGKIFKHKQFLKNLYLSQEEINKVISKVDESGSQVRTRDLEIER